jgi:hypothetical protein
MTDFFTKISGQIAGPIVLGAFFPVVIFLVAVTVILLPITPYAGGVPALVTDPKAWQQGGTTILVITFLVFVSSVLLYNLNVPIVRMFEGYPWRESRIGVWLTKCHQERFDQGSRSRRCIRRLHLEARIAGLTTDLSCLDGVYWQVSRMLNDEYPDERDLVLPTRLGNVIRAFETYTTRQYGMPAIQAWPRLQAVVDASFANSVDAAKTAFDFMINAAFLSALFSVSLVAAGLIWKNPLQLRAYQDWIGWAIVSVCVSYLFYLGAINRAAEWGVQVKAAFDLYRLPLLKKLGFAHEPADLAEERRMWQIINYKFAFPDDRAYPDLPYGVPQTYLAVDPVDTIVTFTRTVSVLQDGTIQIKIAVANTDPLRYEATRVELRDQIPADKRYVPGSATVNGAAAVLLDANPLRIDLGQLPYYETRTVVYRLKSQTT